jgi:hypothetical protein
VDVQDQFWSLKGSSPQRLDQRDAALMAKVRECLGAALDSEALCVWQC